MDTITDKEKIKLLRDALDLAWKHLDYCGYGDSWERECARSSKLDEKIADAMERTKCSKREIR